MNKSYLLSKKNILVLLVICLIAINLHAQVNANKQPNDFWSRVQFGGGIGLGFGDGYFSGTLAPSAIYRLNNYVALGIGLSGTYNTEKNYYKSSIIGGSILGLFNPIPELQLSTEFEQNNVNIDWDSRTDYIDENYWYPSLYLGAGYSTRHVTIGIRYDLLYDSSKSTYLDPWMPFVRVYF
ncbi:alpha-ketoglutarate decarboxylase [Formosa maritima]|uniref:Alpha-ketoglutarate decarboxylase n=1 Tax=Formosa maritima TaxID=2592046 RepID=A0A5D0G0T2_9FLAO|nr:alpha-ketoglutarate decarboxylase [Formosa maritima]TYA52438.1 alpha-ketoglutarate decarboxylase [Formosa maritima]